MSICNSARNYPPLVWNMRDGLNGLRMKQKKITKTTTTTKQKQKQKTNKQKNKTKKQQQKKTKNKQTNNQKRKQGFACIVCNLGRRCSLCFGIRVRQKKNIYMCVSGFPILPTFLARPQTFYCVEIIIIKKILHCGLKTYASILSLRTVSFSAYNVTFMTLQSWNWRISGKLLSPLVQCSVKIDIGKQCGPRSDA